MKKVVNKRRAKLDLKTNLYLYITNAKVVEHEAVKETETKKRYILRDMDIHDVYVFENYDEYKKYFLMYFDDIDDSLIELAIYTHGSKGQIVAHKKLVNSIILKKQVSDFYQSITTLQIDEIHSKGKLTPLEAVQEWQSFDLCVPGSSGILSKNRCDVFDYNCQNCLLECASHSLEHDSIELKIVNSYEPQKNRTK